VNQISKIENPYAALDQIIGTDLDGDLFRFNSKLGTLF
jgi:hypothetical protein